MRAEWQNWRFNRLLARHCELLLAIASKFTREASEAVLTALFCSSHPVRRPSVQLARMRSSTLINSFNQDPKA
jgi:hypothetical protein